MRRTGFCQAFAALLLLLGLHGAAVAESTSAPGGEWVLNLGNHTLFILSLQPASGNGNLFTGSLSRPQYFQTSDASSFSHVQGPTEVEPIVASEWKGNSLSITVQNPADKTDEDTYLLRVKDAAHAELQQVGIPRPPMSLVRANGPQSVFNGWESGRTYSPDDDAPSNPEMKRIFDEDQKVRQPGLSMAAQEVQRKQYDAEREAAK